MIPEIFCSAIADGDSDFKSFRWQSLENSSLVLILTVISAFFLHKFYFCQWSQNSFVVVKIKHFSVFCLPLVFLVLFLVFFLNTIMCQTKKLLSSCFYALKITTILGQGSSNFFYMICLDCKELICAILVLTLPLVTHLKLLCVFWLYPYESYAYDLSRRIIVKIMCKPFS